MVVVMLVLKLQDHKQMKQLTIILQSSTASILIPAPQIRQWQQFLIPSFVITFSFINKMEEGAFDFEVIKSEEEALGTAEYFFDNAYSKAKVFQKLFSQKFFSDMYHHFENPKSSPESKFYTLFTLKELVIENDKNVIGLLSTSQTFLELLQKFALTTDPKKSINEKGKNLFPKDKDGKFGNNFMKLLLEMLDYLGKKFPKTSKNLPTRFKKIIMKLEEDNVIMPKENVFFPQIKSKGEKKEEAQQKQSINQPKKEVNEPAPEKKGGSIQVLIRFVGCKVDEYIETLDELEDEELEQYIHKSHKMFCKENEKFNEFGESIYSHPENVVMDFLKVKGFLEQQISHYEKYIQNNEYSIFFTQIKMSYEETFPKDKENQNITPGIPQPPPSKMEIKPTESIVKSENKKTTKAMEKYEEKEPKESKLENPNLGEALINSRNIMTTIFSKMETRSKSPINGFKLVKESLEKEKSNIHANPPRNRENRGVSGSKMAASTLTRGIHSHSIFKNVPNASPAFKNYEGELVMVSKDLESILFDIKKEQGQKRFKNGNLRDKYSLFENENIQIGFKSEAIFEEYDGFNNFISLELFLGNKNTRHQIRELQVSFEGDENMLIYTSPREMRSVIEPETQIKHELMLIPLNIPYSFVNMKLFFICGSSTTHTTIALPNSILKMTTYIEMERNQFLNYWQNSNSIFKTEMFRLSHHLPPNSFRKNISALEELNIDYSQFSVSGNNEDYELFCSVEIRQNYEGVLKIIIRPDLTVVLQLASIDPSEDATKHLKVFLQTLQLILQED